MQLHSTVDPRVERRLFRKDILRGLQSDPKYLPCKYFYDEQGSKLFDQICQLEEYYPTRSELAIMEKYALEMGQQIGPGVMLVEYGSGSSVKTRTLLENLPDPIAYVPVDISREHLRETARLLVRHYPHIEILPLCADFTSDFDLPIATKEPTHAAVYFPGSTIGNFMPDQATEILDRISRCCGTGGGLLIGIDLKKDVSVMEAAYNDAAGVTAQFNLNLLHRINRELKGRIAVDQFAHQAIYNDKFGRIEMHLVSLCDQVMEIGDWKFELTKGEPICTEYSYKYTVEEFAAIAAKSGLALHRHWTDEKGYFAVLHFAIDEK